MCRGSSQKRIPLVPIVLTRTGLYVQPMQMQTVPTRTGSRHLWRPRQREIVIGKKIHAKGIAREGGSACIIRHACKSDSGQAENGYHNQVKKCLVKNAFHDDFCSVEMCPHARHR